MTPTCEEVPEDKSRESWHGRALRGSGRIRLEEAWALIREIASTDPVLRDLMLETGVDVAICPHRQARMAYAAAMAEGASAGTPRATADAMRSVLVLCDPRRPTPIQDSKRYSDVYTLKLGEPVASATVRAAMRASPSRRADLDARYLAAADRLAELGKPRAAAAMRRHLRDPSAWSR